MTHGTLVSSSGGHTPSGKDLAARFDRSRSPPQPLSYRLAVHDHRNSKAVATGYVSAAAGYRQEILRKQVVPCDDSIRSASGER